MFRTACSLGCVVGLVTAVVLATPNIGWAQRGGGAHFAGGRVGGYHGGGYRAGISYGGTFGPGAPGFGSGYRQPYSAYSSSLFRSHGLYGGYPYLGFFGGEFATPYGGSDLASDPGYAAVTRNYLGDGPPASWPEDSFRSEFSPSAESPAHLTVKVPADAQVWFDGVLMKTTGSVRIYETPPLAPGHYSYEVRARWNQNGNAVTQTQQVGVSRGALVNVDFPTQSGAPGQTPAAQKQ